MQFSRTERCCDQYERLERKSKISFGTIMLPSNSDFEEDIFGDDCEDDWYEYELGCERFRNEWRTKETLEIGDVEICCSFLTRVIFKTTLLILIFQERLFVFLW